MLGHASTEQPLKVETGKTYTPLFVLNAGTLIIRPRPSEGAAVDSGAAVVFEYPGMPHPATYYGESKVVLPAGEQKLTVTIGKGEVKETLQLAAGQTIEKDVVVGVGLVTTNALYAQGGDKVDSTSLFVQILKAAKKIDGSREEMGYSYGADQKFSLPPGDYVALVTVDQASAEAPFNIRVGEAKDVVAVLNAGVLAISAPGATMIKVFEAKKDIQGNRKEFGYAYGVTHQTTLPAGEYAVVVEGASGSAPKEAPASVKAGERSEVTVQ